MEPGGKSVPYGQAVTYWFYTSFKLETSTGDVFREQRLYIISSLLECTLECGWGFSRLVAQTC
eukprot:14874307-Ditylum_brightwellii.AAC.1